MLITPGDERFSKSVQINVDFFVCFQSRFKCRFSRNLRCSVKGNFLPFVRGSLDTAAGSCFVAKIELEKMYHPAA